MLIDLVGLIEQGAEPGVCRVERCIVYGFDLCERRFKPLFHFVDLTCPCANGELFSFPYSCGNLGRLPAQGFHPVLDRRNRLLFLRCCCGVSIRQFTSQGHAAGSQRG